MPRVNDLVSALHAWAPPEHAEGYDNVGLLVGRFDMPITGVLVNLEVTEPVLDEALAHGCNVIVAHHPLWFGKKTRLDGTDWVSRLLLRAIRHEVALVAVHTNLDAVRHGVNAEIGRRLGLENFEVLQPKGEDPSHGPVGSGMVGHLPTPMEKSAFLEHLRTIFGTPTLRFADTHKKLIQTVAFCGGSGSFLLERAKDVDADAFITGDITHHTFFDAEGDLLFVDIGHWESEQYTSGLFVTFLQQNFPNFAVRQSEVRTNPVSYYSGPAN